LKTPAWFYNLDIEKQRILKDSYEKRNHDNPEPKLSFPRFLSNITFLMGCSTIENWLDGGDEGKQRISKLLKENHVVKEAKCQPKGQGAWYAAHITRLTTLHHEILVLLKLKGPQTKQAITKLLNEKRRASKQTLIGGFSVSGRLSELLGLGLLNMRYEKVRLYDRATQTYRHPKKPVWSLTEQGAVVTGEPLKP